MKPKTLLAFSGSGRFSDAQILQRDLISPEYGDAGPIIGTIHASKGREAEEVSLYLPRKLMKTTNTRMRTKSCGSCMWAQPGHPVSFQLATLRGDNRATWKDASGDETAIIFRSRLAAPTTLTPAGLSADQARFGHGCHGRTGLYHQGILYFPSIPLELKKPGMESGA